MAVRAEEREVVDRAGLLAADVQRLDVVALGIALAALAVQLGEVEVAYLAGERLAVRADAIDLLPRREGFRSR
jgi:hypothetical protein